MIPRRHSHPPRRPTLPPNPAPRPAALKPPAVGHLALPQQPGSGVPASAGKHPRSAAERIAQKQAAPVKPVVAAAGKAPTHWEHVADWYDTLQGDQGSDYHQKIILPNVLRLLSPYENNADPAQKRPPKHLLGNYRVLDLACGQGVLSRQLAAEGAKVVGVDGSPALIEAARRREAQGEKPLGLTYHVADVTKMSPLPAPLVAGSFDAVTIIMAIQNITPLAPVWQACREALAPGGYLLIVMMHPCFRVFRHSAWRWDEGTKSQSRQVDEYLTSSKAEIQMQPGAVSSGGAGSTTLSFHRPLQAYINTLAHGGLLTDRIEEWPSHRKPPAGIRFEALDKSRREIPVFMAIRARKIESTHI